MNWEILRNSLASFFWNATVFLSVVWSGFPCGRIPLMLEAARRLRLAAPEIHLSIALSGPFTIATQLIGLAIKGQSEIQMIFVLVDIQGQSGSTGLGIQVENRGT